MKNKVYLDNSATTPLRPEAKEAMTAAMDVVGNPSSVHQFGQEAKFLLDDARRKVAALVNVRPEQIMFTAGGTEANVTALQGVMKAREGKRLITSPTEHDSIVNTAKAMKEDGVDVYWLRVDEDGIIDLSHLESELEKGDVSLVSIMHANNETGAEQPVQVIAQLCHQYGAYYHCDAVQTVGLLKVDFAAMGIDLLTISAHKFGGPQGTGALVIGGNVEMEAIITGGAQERNRRAGTENMLGIVGMGAAAAAAVAELGEKASWIQAQREELEGELKRLANDIEIVSEGAERAPHITQFITPGLDGADAVIALDLEGVAISQGSACSSGRVEPSHVLMAQGYEDDEANSGLRVSWGWANKSEDRQKFMEAFKTVYKRLVKED